MTIPPAPHLEPARPSGGGAAALVLGVVAVLLFLTRIAFLSVPAFGLGLAAVVLAWRRLASWEGGTSGKGAALAGLILGALAVVFALAVFLLPLVLGI